MLHMKEKKKEDEEDRLFNIFIDDRLSMPKELSGLVKVVAPALGLRCTLVPRRESQSCLWLCG